MGLRKGINVVLENNDGTNNSRHVRKLRASVYKLDSSVNDDQTHTYINIYIYVCVNLSMTFLRSDLFQQ